MESTRKHLTNQQDRGTGLGREFRQLAEDGSASAAELQEFLQHLKGRSPEEVMGVVAGNGLFQGIVTATIGCAAVLAVLTLIPYALQDTSAAKQEEAAAAVADDAQAATAAEGSGAAESGTVAADKAGGSPPEPDLQRAADAMGIGETAEADPDVNPLDSKLDKLLDGIE